jgi:BASS family bile acid:Na+ symporter
LISASKWVNAYYKYLILLAVVAGFILPSAAIALKPATPLAVAGIIFSLGLVTARGNFRKVADRPTILLTGLALTFIATPLTGAAIASILLAQSSDLAFGLVLTSSMACGNAVGTWTALAGGDIPLAIMLLSTSTALTPFATPLLASLLGGRYISFDPTKTFTDLIMMILLPLAASRFLASKFSKNLRGRDEVPMAFSSGLAILLGYIVVGNASQPLISSLPTYASALLVISVVVQSATGFLIGYFVPSLLLRVDRGSAIAMAYSTGSKNNSIAMAIALAQFSPLTALPPMIYLLTQIGISSLALSRFQKKAAAVGSGEGFSSKGYESAQEEYYSQDRLVFNRMFCIASAPLKSGWLRRYLVGQR